MNAELMVGVMSLMPRPLWLSGPARLGGVAIAKLDGVLWLGGLGLSAPQA